MTYPYKAAIIEWVDAFDGEDTWVYKGDYKIDPALPVTIGWVLENQHPEYVTMISTFCVFNDKPDLYSNVMHVPVGMVKSLTYIDIPAKISKQKKRRSESNAR
jgi:hypothetical protein